LNNVGAVPVTMHWGEEVYKALQARTMDGLMVNVDSGYDLKVHEHASYALVSKDLWLGHLYPLVMNLDTWNGLEQEDKQAIQRAAEIAYKSLGAVMDRSFDAQIEALRKGGTTVRVLGHKEVQNFKAATRYQEAQVVWAKDQESKGLTDASAVLKKVSAILNEALE
ncbi:MAG: TRAP transporter substrate-binding protein DctP, partial [Ferruginibacter sp.]|nr:TRAP transporter substrate-binding protein DctP [Rhodoferax sp.]